MKFDLHLHSHYSDGKLSPRELVLACRKEGVDLMALTDHDNVGGIPEALTVGREAAIKVIPGVEFSVNDPDGREQHLLGYLLDYQSPELRIFMEASQKRKLAAIDAMVLKLRDREFIVDLMGVISHTRGSVNRSHIAYAVFDNPENVLFLQEKFGIKDTSGFFNAFLKAESPHSVYVSSGTRPAIKDVIKMVKALGGISVWTHPFWHAQPMSKIAQNVALFRSFGLDGLEVLYSRSFHTREQALALHGIATKLNVFETGGSDFHSYKFATYSKIADFDTFGLELNLPLRFLEEA